MKVTIDHPTSSYGFPVILDDDEKPMDYDAGVKAIRKTLDLSVDELGALCGVSGRTVQGWEQGRLPTAAGLNVLGKILRTKRTTAKTT